MHTCKNYPLYAYFGDIAYNIAPTQVDGGAARKGYRVVF